MEMPNIDILYNRINLRYAPLLTAIQEMQERSLLNNYEEYKVVCDISDMVNEKIKDYVSGVYQYQLKRYLSEKYPKDNQL